MRIILIIAATLLLLDCNGKLLHDTTDEPVNAVSQLTYKRHLSISLDSFNSFVVNNRLDELSDLRFLEISDKAFTCLYLPKELYKLQKLDTLSLVGFINLRTLSDTLFNFASLQHFSISLSSALQYISLEMLNVPSVEVRSCGVVEVIDSWNGETQNNNNTQLSSTDSQLVKLFQVRSNNFKVRKLSITNSGINGFPENIDSNYLYSLKIENTNLSELPPAISSYHELRSICLSSNHLTSFPLQLFDIPYIEFIDLSGNSIIFSTHGDWPFSESIRSLNLSACSLKRIPIDIYKYSTLESLYLSNNNLKTIPKGISQLHDLRILDLSSNPIVTLPIEITSMKNLERLEVSFNLSQEKISQLTDLYSKALPNTKIYFRSINNE